jgi:2-polyprenyl-3-methyl-5-hydroxy-6-metoxy-1,4-benzoquinol methylase
MRDETKFHEFCLLCGSRSLKSIYGNDHFLTKCSSCSFVFSRAIPTQTELQDFYDQYPLEDRISPLTIERYNEILDMFEPYRSTGKLLEFGCGEGYFLEEARKRNWQIVGIEIATQLIDKCKKKNIEVYDSLEKIKASDIGNFDIVVSIEVIEHLSPPTPFVQDFKKQLRTGGALYMTTPNFNCLSRLLIGRKWNNIVYPEHLCYYTPKTINKLLKDNQFERVFVKTTGISIARYKHAFLNWNRKKNEDSVQYDYNEKDRELRESIENSKILAIFKNILNRFFNFTQLGESLKILYTKK